MTYLPYVEPGLDIILPLSTFIFILNITRDVLDDLLYCGLIGEIFIGILFGMPITGTSWLGMEIQQTVQYLGYLGLICLVFEGGLITDLGLLRKTIWVTLSAAMVGILVPMALSFSIMSMRFTTVGGSGYPTALAAFSAGVSLCSTSLGSTFIILASANLQKSPTGTLIAGAAMLDDIIVLVMVKIVTALGQGQPDPWRIARPAVSSIGLILATFLLAPFLIKPIYKASSFIFARQKTGPENFGEYQETEKGFSRHTGFILSTLMLIILVTITAYVEGSVLLSAFLAGAIIRYIWQDASNPGVDPPTVMFKAYYKPILDHILVPFFFASIGFSIPLSEMFSSSIIWKGIFYAFLMFLAKASVGLVIYIDCFTKNCTRTSKTDQEIAIAITHQDETFAPSTPKPIPPHLEALIVGSTMIARGGFGFLVASEAQSSGTLGLKTRSHPQSQFLSLSHPSTLPLKTHFSTSSANQGFHTVNVVEDQIFLVIIWALVLCTIAGPIVSGFAVRRKLKGAGCRYGCGFVSREFGEEGEREGEEAVMRVGMGEGGCHLCL